MLGESYLQAFSGINYLITRRLREDLEDGRSTWIDDIKTNNKIEKINEIVYGSVVDAINEIKEKFGENWSNGNGEMLTL